MKGKEEEKSRIKWGEKVAADEAMQCHQCGTRRMKNKNKKKMRKKNFFSTQISRHAVFHLIFNSKIEKKEKKNNIHFFGTKVYTTKINM